MSTYTLPKPTASRPFILTVYREEAGAEYPEPVLPDRCVVGVDDDVPCLVRADFERQRVKGPGFPLVVARCDIHEVGFTLYPPGWGPYRRQPLTGVDHEGAVITGDDGQIDLQGTVFEAATDAADGTAWERECTVDDEPWWGTQWWHLVFGMLLLGVHSGLDDRIRERVAVVLDVPLVALSDARSRGAQRGYRAKGGAIMDILSRLPCDARRTDHRLVRAGAVVGLWGRPLWWDERAGTLRPLAYPGADTTVHPGSSRSPIRSTSSVRGGPTGFG